MASRARSRISPSEPARIGLADALAERVEVEVVATAEALLRQVLLERLALDGAEEEAVEQHVEHVPVLLRLGERGGQRLAEVLLRGPAHRVERLERVEQLGRADRHAPRRAARRRTRAAAAPCPAGPFAAGRRRTGRG
jgi:hypothetical protein